MGRSSKLKAERKNPERVALQRESTQLEAAIKSATHSVRKALRKDKSEDKQQEVLLAIFEELDETLSHIDKYAAPHGGQLACQKGCSSCCYLYSDILQVEAVAIARYLKETLTPDNYNLVVERIKSTYERTQGMTPRQRSDAIIPCALLSDDGACMVYPVRPMSCRIYHSLDANMCKKSLGNGEGTLAVNWPRGIWGDAIKKALKQGLEASNIELEEVELHEALCKDL